MLDYRTDKLTRTHTVATTDCPLGPGLIDDHFTFTPTDWMSKTGELIVFPSHPKKIFFYAICLFVCYTDPDYFCEAFAFCLTGFKHNQWLVHVVPVFCVHRQIKVNGSRSRCFSNQRILVAVLCVIPRWQIFAPVDLPPQPCWF